tara:strand:- start:918 stop:1142 length:225 start_codon:yes stop_codon:yes gene_type:complete
MEKDWLYSPDRMQLREQCLSILLNKFGTEINEDGSLKVPTESIYACAHDWVSQGHPSPMGIVAYFEAYHKDGQA